MEQMLFAVAIAIIGWLAKTVDKLNDSVVALRLDLQTNYVTHKQCEEKHKSCSKE